ncbi:MAG: hypothetical protein CMN34_03805, partial [Saprospirales bacterium]|nr:hypothetical protein [Saprospirales bacterium]
QGLQGERGLRGEAGDDGEAGNDGLQGIKGEEGLQGIKGDAGNDGLQGIQGLQGLKGEDGLQGIKGEEGLQGLKGDAGENGLQGLKGEEGLQGIKGEAGENGLQGIKGDAGNDGLQGIQGLQGLKGEAGENGLQGLKGDAGENGLQGIQGLQGLKGEDGLQGERGEQGLQGNDGTEGLQGIKGEEGLQGLKGEEGLQGSKGEQGLQGIKGEEGLQGIKGEDGLQGLKGEAGENGLQGIKGEEGLQGIKGEEGLQGIKGENGLQGIKGEEGLQGLKGEAGDDGEAGEDGLQGIKGDAGENGLQGIKGEDGLQGIKGEQGEEGLQGNTGSEGLQGNTGEQGLQGIQGIQGESIQGRVGPIGPQGRQGEQGEQGKPGLPGMKGEQGLQGIQGLQGSKGEEGLQGLQGLQGEATIDHDWYDITTDESPTSIDDDIYTNGKVGINTKEPTKTLQVEGDIFISGEIDTNGNSNRLFFETHGLQDPATNWIGTINSYELAIANRRGEAGHIVVGNQNLRFGFDVPDDLNADNEPTTNNTVMFIDHKTIETIETGYVGIGTSVPTGQLHIKSINNNTGEWAQKITDSTDSDELVFGIENDGYLNYPHSTKGTNKILTSIDDEGKSEWKTKEELGIAVPGLHSVALSCDGESELKGDTDIYAFIDTTSGAYSSTYNNEDDDGWTNRAIIYEALTNWYNDYKAEHPDFTGKLYIAQHYPTANSERWLHHLPLICNSNVSIRTNTDQGFNGETSDMTSAGSTAISNDNSLGKWMKTGSYKTYSWTCDGMPPNWDNDDYEIPNRVFIIDFCNESHNEYQSFPSWLSNAEYQSADNSNSGTRVGYKMIPSHDEWQNYTLTSEWIADYSAFIAAKDTLDYFGAVLYPVTRGGDATHLHMYAAVEGGSTIEKTDFEDALGPNWPGVSDTKQDVIQGSTDTGFSKFQPLSPVTSFTTSDYRNSTSNMSDVEVLTHKVFGNNVTSINNPYENHNLKNHGYNGVYDKQEANGVLDFDSEELGEDLNSILQPVQQESMANVVKHFNDEGELFIKGFISETIRFTETDEDCIRMELKDTEDLNFAHYDLTFDGNRTHDLNGNSLKIEDATNGGMFNMVDGRIGMGIVPQTFANVHIHHQGDDTTTPPEYNLLISQKEGAPNDELTKVSIGFDPFYQSGNYPPVEIYAQQNSFQGPRADLVFATQSGGNWRDPVIDRLKIKSDGYLQYPHSTKGTGKILTSINDEGDAEWKSKAELNIAEPGLHSIVKTCDGESELKGDTDIYVFVDITSGPYFGISASAKENRAIVFDALDKWYTKYKLDNTDFTGKLYIALTNSERWLRHSSIVCSDNHNDRINVASATLYTGVGDFMNRGWIETSTYTGTDGSYSWTTAGIPPNWGSTSGYEIPTRIFDIEFCNESASDYHASSSYTTYAQFAATEPETDYEDDYKAFMATYVNLDYFGGLVYPVANVGGNPHLHMYSAIEGGKTIEKVDLQVATGPNYNSMWETSIFDDVAPNTSYENPYFGVKDRTLNNYNWFGVYNKQTVSSKLDFTDVEFSNDINDILQPVQQESMANVVKHFITDPAEGNLGELFIRGFVSNSINFEYTDDDCISMEINNGSSANAGGNGGDDGDWIVNGTDMYNTNDGNVGIGVSDPENQLHVESDDHTIIKVASSNTSGKDAGVLITTRGSQDWGIFNHRTTKDLRFVNTGRADFIDTEDKRLVTFHSDGYITSHKLGALGGGNVVADSTGKLIIGSAGGGDDDGDWIRVTPDGGASNSGLVPKNSTDVVGIGSGARTASKSYGLYINGGTTKKAAALYTNFAGPSVYVQNSNTTTSGDGIHIALFGPGGTTRESSQLQRNLSPGSDNNRFLDFSWNGVESGFLAIRRKGNILENTSNESIGLQNRSDGRLKLNQRPIEYTLDDFAEIPLKSYEWQKPVAEYYLFKEFNITDSIINCEDDVIKINKDLSELNDKYIFIENSFKKVKTEFDGSGSTVINVLETSTPVCFEESMTTISAYTQTVTMEETGVTGHGVVTQDLLELPKFSGITTDWESRNVERGLKEGDLNYSYQTVDYVEFMPAIMAGLQDANKLIKELRQEVDDLKEQLKNK